MTQERVKAGLARAVARGAKLGRPRISTRKEHAMLGANGKGVHPTDRGPSWGKRRHGAQRAQGLAGEIHHGK
jgi:hypothetical protein